MSNPQFLITDDAYNPIGAVIQDGGRWIGHDTTGNTLFNRKDFNGAQQATKKIGRMVTTAYYGVDAASETVTAPDAMRRRDTERQHRVHVPWTKFKTHRVTCSEYTVECGSEDAAETLRGQIEQLGACTAPHRIEIRTEDGWAAC